jgi:hypothetical protein
MPPTVAQVVASIIATRAEGFLEPFEGSGVINLTSAQKLALARELVNDRTFHFDLQGSTICLCSPEWRKASENVGKRWITVRVHEHNRKMGPRSARYTEYKFGLAARLSSWQGLPGTDLPYEDYIGGLFFKQVTARYEITADMRCEVFESFLSANWSICTECGCGRMDEKMIGTACSRSYTSKCMGAAIKRRKISD